MSPTQRTLAALRADGYTAAVVEHFNPHVKIRQDLFGFGDILAMKAGAPILIVQATGETGSGNFQPRLAKILALENGAPVAWLRAGGRVEVWAWARRRSTGLNRDGSRSKRMVNRVRKARLELDGDALGWVDVAGLDDAAPTALALAYPETPRERQAER